MQDGNTIDKVIKLYKAGYTYAMMTAKTGCSEQTLRALIGKYNFLQRFWRWQPPEYYRRKSMGKIKVWIKDPKGKPRHVNISNTLENLQKIVGGPIEVVEYSHNMLIICNEEGLIRNLDINCHVGTTLFFGTIIICGRKGEEFDDCPLDNEMFKFTFPHLFDMWTNYGGGK